MSAIRKIENLTLTPPVYLTVVSDTNSTNQIAATGAPIVVGVRLDTVLGQVLDINILGAGSKICSYNCVYCQMGPTTIRLNQIKKETRLPSAADIVREVSNHVSQATGADADFETICLAGNGEPTLHPDFPEIAAALHHARRTAFPQKKLAIRTNASTLESRKILDGVNLFDDRVVKLDVGNDRLFKSFNNPLTRKTLTRLIGDIRGLKDVLIETLFVQGNADNTQPSDLEEWMEVVAMAQPKRVHIRTVASTNNMNGILPCSEDTLYTIASRFERRTQIRAIVSV